MHGVIDRLGFLEDSVRWGWGEGEGVGVGVGGSYRGPCSSGQG